MLAREEVDVMSIESKGKLICFFKGSVTIDHDFDVAEDKHRFCEVFSLWPAIVVLLSNSRLEWLIEV